MNETGYKPIRPRGFFCIGVGLLALASAQSVQAIPGQSTSEAKSWILAHPTLRPARGETFFIRRSDTPAHRLEFKASPLPPGRITTLSAGGTIRSEEISLYDMTNGINKYRLEESIRAIYGAEIYQDYRTSNLVLTYPKGILQGELRAGDRYAYWLEIAHREDGFAYTGRATVFLKRDLEKLENELQNR